MGLTLSSNKNTKQKKKLMNYLHHNYTGYEIILLEENIYWSHLLEHINNYAFVILACWVIITNPTYNITHLNSNCLEIITSQKIFNWNDMPMKYYDF
jgi:hypothetical protein